MLVSEDFDVCLEFPAGYLGMRASRGWSGGCGESCCVEPADDLVVDDAERVAERGRGLGLVAGHQRAPRPAARRGTCLPRRAAAVHDQTGACPVQWHDGQAVVTLPEHIDVSNSGLIREHLLVIINRGASPLVVDMTATVSCDYSGAAAVARAFRRATASGTGLRLAVIAGPVRRVLSLTGLDRLVSIYPSLEAATAARASAARPPLALVGSPAGTGANGRPATCPPDAPPGADTAITPAVIWEMVESFYDGVALADGSGAIMLASRRLEEMFGYGHAELTSHSIERLVPADLQAAHRGHRAGYARAPVARLMGAGARLAGLRKDGTTFPVEISLSPLTTRTGQFTVAVVRDTTQARQLEEAAGLARAAAAAERAYRDRELLDTIITRLQRARLTLQSTASQAPHPAADAIHDATAQLSDIIRDIRDTMLTTDPTEPWHEGGQTVRHRASRNRSQHSSTQQGSTAADGQAARHLAAPWHISRSAGNCEQR